jgi:diadenosine tetraphosphate (Ap4A) HIT family hydrolase
MEDEYARFLGEEKKQLKFNFNNKKGETWNQIHIHLIQKNYFQI